MYYLLGLSVLVASMNSVFLSKANVKKKNEIFNFNLLCSAIWFIILFSLNGGRITFKSDVIFFGILYGLTQASFILFKTLAMSTGPVSVTTLIGNSSMLISLIFSTIVWNEPVSAIDVLGLLLLACSIFLCTYRKKTDAPTVKADPKWKYFALIFLILAAAVGIVFKAFGKAGNSEYCNDMLCIAAIVMIMFHLIASTVAGGFKKQENPDKKLSFFLTAALISGILSCVYNRINILLAGKMNAVIFFPCFNGGVILVSAILSAIILKERFKRNQIIGIALGILAICVIGIF